MKCYVYAHLKPDGTIFYVGKGTHLNRAKQKTGRNKHWQNVVNKYGFSAIILVDNLTEEQAFFEEIELIKHFKKFGFLTNKTNGGDGVSGAIMPKWQKERVKKGEHHTQTQEYSAKRKEIQNAAVKEGKWVSPMLNPEFAKKQSETKKNAPFAQCPHCGINRRKGSNMTRYHFDNCRKRERALFLGA